jgi:hypothetical protein
LGDGCVKGKGGEGNKRSWLTKEKKERKEKKLVSPAPMDIIQSPERNRAKKKKKKNTSRVAILVTLNLIRL